MTALGKKQKGGKCSIEGVRRNVDGKKKEKKIYIRKTVSREENIFIKKTLNDRRTEKKNSRKKKMERQRKRNRERGGGECLRPLPTHFLGHL